MRKKVIISLIIVTIFLFISYLISSFYKEQRFKKVLTKNDLITFRNCAVTKNDNVILISDKQGVDCYKANDHEHFFCTDSPFQGFDHTNIPKNRRDSILDRFLYLNVNTVFCHSQKIGMRVFVNGMIFNDIMLESDTFKIYPFYVLKLPSYPGTFLYY